MKKLTFIVLTSSLLMLSACSHPEEASVPAETSAPETAVSDMQTLPPEVIAKISASETHPESETQNPETVPETETIPAESSGSTETVMTDTVPAESETSAVSAEETVPETLPETEEQPVMTETEISETSASVSMFQNTCWAGIDENHSEIGLLFGSDAVSIIQIDGNSELSKKEYQYSADADFLYWKRDGEEDITKSWTLSEETNQLMLTDKASGETVTFYAVDGSTEEEVIAVMDALALMQ